MSHTCITKSFKLMHSGRGKKTKPIKAYYSLHRYCCFSFRVLQI